MKSPQKKIFFVGMPSSGKTVLGKSLAKAFNLTFIDLDARIIAQEGMSIPQIFESQGEDFFRQSERRALKTAVEAHEAFVLSTGGGAPCFYDNMDFINENGTSIYLKVSTSTIAKRVIGDGTALRPLFKGLNKAACELKISQQLAHRSKYYEKAKLIVEGDDILVEDVISALQGIADSQDMR